MVLFFSFGGVHVYAGSVEAVHGSTPIIDGVMAAGEWVDASTVTFSGPSGTCTVYVKQDGIHLNIAVHVPDNTVDQFDWVEVCLDTNHDHGSRPQTDDYGLLMTRGFVSHLRQESVGDGFNWVSQAISGWVSSAAWTNSEYTIELSISYAKLGITAGTAKTLGVEFQVWDDSGSTKYRWTAGSDNSNPSTWGEVTSYWSYPIHQGDLVLTGNNVTVIEGRFDINGSIVVEENATLVLRNAVVNFTQVEPWQFNITFRNPANGNPRLLAENTTIDSIIPSLALPILFFGNSSVTAYKLNILGNMPIWMYNSSIASISNSTLRVMALGQDSVTSLSDSALDGGISLNERSTFAASNCTFEYLIANGASEANVLNSLIFNRIEPRAHSVDCSINELKSGYIEYWAFRQNCSVIVALDGEAPNITLNNTQVGAWRFSFFGSSNITILSSELRDLVLLDFGSASVYNSSFSGFVDSQDDTTLHIHDSTTDGIYSSENSVVSAVNLTTNDYWSDDLSIIYFGWYLDVHVIDSVDQDVPSANVTATSPNAMVESKLSDANGWARLTLMEKMMNATGEYSVGNYTVEATYEIFSDATTVNMTGNQQITLTLEGFVIPEFPSFLILPLFTIAALIAVIIYRKKQWARIHK